MHLCRQVDTLHSCGSISVDDPADLMLQDVKVIAESLRGWEVSVNTRAHVPERLNMLCKFCGNMVVEHAKALSNAVSREAGDPLEGRGGSWRSRIARGYWISLRCLCMTTGNSGPASRLLSRLPSA